jgi:PKD repeat protein
MKSMSRKAEIVSRGGGAAVLCAALLIGACGLDKESIPVLGGPSELGTSLKLTASPDVLTADGFSTSLVQVQVFDQNGQPLAGSTILLALQNSTKNSFFDLGTLYSSSGSLLRAAEATVVTNGSGVATAVYTAPPRTDFTANGSVVVAARPVGTDANGVIYRSVTIELKSAEPILFPQNDGNSPPNCNFVMEAPIGDADCSSPTVCTVKVGAQVLFQDTSSDPDAGDHIVRYEWFFGDGTGVQYHTQENHVFHTANTYTITHRVTDSFGAQSACQATVNVQ